MLQLQSFYFQSRQAVFNQALDEGPQGPEHKISVCMTCPLAHFSFRYRYLLFLGFIFCFLYTVAAETEINRRILKEEKKFYSFKVHVLQLEKFCV